MKFKWRNPYDDVENAIVGDACGTVNNDPTMTVESFAEDADINVLVRRFGITGVPVIPLDPSQFGDFSQAPDLRGALEIFRDAEEKFSSLPAKVRSRFRNDPTELWDFLQDPENLEEGVRLGLLQMREESETGLEGPPAGVRGGKPPEPRREEKPRERAPQGGSSPPGDPPGEAGK